MKARIVHSREDDEISNEQHIELSNRAAKNTSGMRVVSKGISHTVLSCKTIEVKQDYFTEYHILKENLKHELLHGDNGSVLGFNELPATGDSQSTPRRKGASQRIQS